MKKIKIIITLLCLLVAVLTIVFLSCLVYVSKHNEAVLPVILLGVSALLIMLVGGTIYELQLRKIKKEN